MSSAPPGWYPDPAARPGHYRYWDGRAWSPTTTTRVGASPNPAPIPARPPVPALPPRKRSRPGWIPGLSIGLLALVLVLVVVVRPWSQQEPSPTPVRTATAPVSPGQVCGRREFDSDSTVPTSNGRVQSGALTVPLLAAPFAAPTRTTQLRYRYLDEVASHWAVLRYQGHSTGGAEVVIAGLPLIDGVTTVKEAAGVVFGCERRRFPSAPEDGRSSKATTVDGRPAWLIRSHFSYGKPEAGVHSGIIIVLVVALTEGANGLFYAYLPDTHPELVPVGERAMQQLEVR